MKSSFTLKLILFMSTITLFGCTTSKEEGSHSYSEFSAGTTYYGKLITQDEKGPFYIIWQPDNDRFLVINKQGREMIYPSKSVQEIRYKTLTEKQGEQFAQIMKKKQNQLIDPTWTTPVLKAKSISQAGQD